MRSSGDKVSKYKTVNSLESKDYKRSSDVNHNNETRTMDDQDKNEAKPQHDLIHFRNCATEVIELPNDGRLEIVASRRFGRPVTSSRDKDEIAITFDQGDTIRIKVDAESKSSVQNILQRCGARIPHGPVFLDLMVSGIAFTYALLLVLLLANVRQNWNYLGIMMLWFFYIIVRVQTYQKQPLLPFKQRIWHFTGISFSVMFMYGTVITVFPILTQEAFYQKNQGSSEQQANTTLIMSALKASTALALLGMAARRSFHCGKILSHMDVIKSLLLENFDVFNLVETLSLRQGASLIIPKGSAMSISVLVACELAFLVVLFEALMPYSLITLDRRRVGKIRQNVSAKRSKEQAIMMVYPYLLFIQNVPFLVIRVALYAFYDIVQVVYVVKNVASILFGVVALIRAVKAEKKDDDMEKDFLSIAPQARRISV